MKKLVPLVLSILFSNLSFAQTAIFKAEYKLLVEESSEEDDLGFLADNSISFCYSGSRSIVSTKAMGGMLESSIIDNYKSDSAIMLYGLIGDKYLLRLEKNAAFDNTSSSYMELDSIVSFTYDETNRKTILGYSCYLAIATLSNKKTANFYITEEIETRFPNENLLKLQLKGFPMEYYVIAEGVTSGYTITSFSTEEIDCNYDLTLYKELSQEEFIEMMNSF